MLQIGWEGIIFREWFLFPLRKDAIKSTTGKQTQPQFGFDIYSCVTRFFVSFIRSRISAKYPLLIKKQVISSDSVIFLYPLFTTSLIQLSLPPRYMSGRAGFRFWPRRIISGYGAATTAGTNWFWCEQPYPWFRTWAYHRNSQYHRSKARRGKIFPPSSH